MIGTDQMDCCETAGGAGCVHVPDGHRPGHGRYRVNILQRLYEVRRSRPEHPGVSVRELDAAAAVSHELLAFGIWYLKEKQFIRQNESSDFEITAAGVDYVEALGIFEGA